MTMTDYTEKFTSCRTTGECRRIKVSLLDKTEDIVERHMIELAYNKRYAEIRPHHGTAKVVLE